VDAHRDLKVYDLKACDLKACDLKACDLNFDDPKAYAKMAY
jgi:hypothetical protein